MLELNKVMLIGNLTRDPELNYVSSGRALAKLGLAVSRRYKDRNGEQREETAFVDIDAWGNTAEFCAKYLQKGRRIYVEGRLKFDQWEASDGSRRSKLAVTAERVQFADPPRSSGGGQSGGDQPQQNNRQQNASGGGPRRQQGPPPARNNAGQGSEPFSGSSPSWDDENGGGGETEDDLPF